MNNPISAHDDLRESVLRYIRTAFGTRSETFETDRNELLAKDGGVFQEPYIEPIIPYKTSVALTELRDQDLSLQLNPAALQAFRDLCSARLFSKRGGMPAPSLYLHQVQMLRDSLAS